MIKSLFKRKHKSQIIYNNCDIPAKLFYNEIIAKSNLSVLGTGTPEELQAALWSIIDELCVIEDNQQLQAVYKKRELVSRIQSVIAAIKAGCHALMYLEMTPEQHKKVIDSLNRIEFVDVKFDVNKPRIEEIDRVLKRVVGSLNNRLKMNLEDEDKKTEKAITSFEKMWSSMVTALAPAIIPNDCSLKEFAELKNRVKEKIKAHGAK